MVNQPSPNEAQAHMDDIERARSAAVTVARRPAAVDLCVACTLGLTVGLAVLRTAPAVIAAVVVLIVGSAGYWVAERHWTRRRGRILDERTLSHAIRYLPFYAALLLIGQIPAPGDWQPWFSIVGGLAATVLAFGYLRLDERYQVKRLGAGDFSRHDLV
jgi:hypothetical protein